MRARRMGMGDGGRMALVEAAGQRIRRSRPIWCCWRWASSVQASAGLVGAGRRRARSRAATSQAPTSPTIRPVGAQDVSPPATCAAASRWSCGRSARAANARARSTRASMGSTTLPRDFLAGATPRATLSYFALPDNAAGPRDGNGERAVMATNKKNADKKSPEKEIPERKNNDKKILAFVERCDNAGELESADQERHQARQCRSPKRLSGSGFRSFRPNSRGRWSTISGRRSRRSSTRLAGTGQDHAAVPHPPEGRQGRRRADAARWAPGGRRTAGFKMLLLERRHAGVHRRGHHLAPSSFQTAASSRAAQQETPGWRGVDLTSLR